VNGNLQITCKRYLVQLVTVRWGYCSAEVRLILLRCSAVLGSDSSLSLTSPTGQR